MGVWRGASSGLSCGTSISAITMKQSPGNSGLLTSPTGPAETRFFSEPSPPPALPFFSPQRLGKAQRGQFIK